MTDKLTLAHLMGYSTLALVLSTATWAPPWAPVAAAPVTIFGVVHALDRTSSSSSTADQALAADGGDP